MENNKSDEFIYNSNVTQGQFETSLSSDEKPGLTQNKDINEAINVPQPISYPLNTPPQNYNPDFTQGYQQPYNPNIPPQGYQQPYNPNIPPQGYQQPYNPNIPPQGYQQPYNIDQGYPYNQTTIIQHQQYPYRSTPAICGKTTLLVMAILQFLIIITDIILLAKVDYGSGTPFIIVDDVGILAVSVLFFLSFLFNIPNKDEKINGLIRSLVTVLVWFIGFALRGISIGVATFDDDPFDDKNNHWSWDKEDKKDDDEINSTPYIIVMVIRGLVLFFSIPVSFMNTKRVSSSNIITVTHSPISPM